MDWCQTYGTTGFDIRRNVKNDACLMFSGISHKGNHRGLPTFSEQLKETVTTPEKDALVTAFEKCINLYIELRKHEKLSINTKGMNQLKIELLADHPEALPILIELFESQWAPYYGVDGPGDAAADIINSANRTKLPIAVVAIVNDKVCGTAALKMASVTTYPDYFPWLAGLLVAPEYRKQGIGEQLIAKIEGLAKQFGYKEIYVGTGDKSGMSEITLDKRNWQFIDKRDYFVSETSVFIKRL